MAAPDTLTDISDLAGLADPFPALAALREAGPVTRMTMNRAIPVWVVTRPDDVLAALSDPRLSSDPRTSAAMTELMGDDVLSRSMLISDPPEHTRLRRLVSKAFTARRVEALRPRIEEVTDELLDRIAQRGRAELISEFALPLPITVIGELLGVPPADRERFRAWTDEMLETPLERRMEPEQMAAAVAQLRSYVGDLITAKRQAPADDLLTGLIEASDEDGGLDGQELLSMTFLLLVAGYVTTVNLIGNGTLALLRAPEQLDRLRADPSLVPGAVEEFLRFDGPVNVGITRYAAEDLEIAGVPVARGDVVMLATAAADRDPDRHPDPDRLDVTAGSRHHLGFGHGIHYCLGAPLARLEARIAFTAILARLPDLALAVPVEELRWSAGGLRGLRALPVVFRPTVRQAPA
ncbi:cytochrome P450 [Modestobacter sp. I12A-02662]|uniref:cytochrome P450 family protein n=1 Tax=Modestobacter sp. I12A-02662 TaxID=1730496 RepID=UPI0034DF4690